MTGEVTTTGSSYLTFVAVDENGEKNPVPPVIPETDEERMHFDTAPERRRLRIERKQERTRRMLPPET